MFNSTGHARGRDFTRPTPAPLGLAENFLETVAACFNAFIPHGCGSVFMCTFVFHFERPEVGGVTLGLHCFSSKSGIFSVFLHIISH